MIDGRPVIVTGGPLAGLVELVRQVRRLGATKVLALGNEGRGSGPVPDQEEAESLVLEVPPVTSMIEGIRASQTLLADLPAHAHRILDDFDPAGEALVVASFLNEVPEVAGRPALAYRRPDWLALEDKTRADELWERCGLAHTPSEVVAAERGALLAATRRLDEGWGTVWAADATKGYNGGAEGLRWVRGDDVDEAVAFMAARAERVRIMPFLEGIPCSIHGIVFPDYVAALRPLEMVTLRPESGAAFFYAGVASYWDPSPADREEMRSAARSVGSLLRQEVGFRGPFTIDGVMTTEGFLPTELNPRCGAGLGALSRGLGDLPIQVLIAAISGGSDLDYRPVELEALLVDRADARRGGGTWRAVPDSVPEIVGRPLVGDERGYRWADQDDMADGWLIAGPSTLGAFLRLTLNASRMPIGASVAPHAVAFYQFADDVLGTSIGPLQAAKAVR